MAYTTKFTKRTGARTFDNYTDGLGFSVDYADIEEQLGKMDRFAILASEEWDKAMRDALPMLHREVVDRIDDLTGELRGSMGSKMWSDSLLSIYGEVGSNIQDKWPLSVELGRKAGKMPPISEMPGGNSNEQFLIARAIARGGTKGKFFMYHGKNAAAEGIEDEFNEANARIMKRLEVK